MLSYPQILHFRTFGFVVLPKYLSGGEAQALRLEVSENLAAAYGEAFRERHEDVPGLLLPTMTDSTPLGRSLVADDSRFWDAAHELLGRQCVPSHAEANCFYRGTSWHADFADRTPTVKFMAYLDRTTENSALRVIPTSQSLATHTSVREYLSGLPTRRGSSDSPTEDWSVPSVAIATEPGDVIAFDGNLLHAASSGAGRRLAWNVQYFGEPAPDDLTGTEVIRDLIAYSSDTSGYGYDHERWPVWGQWRANLNESAARKTAYLRLKKLGVFSVEGIDRGEPHWDPVVSCPFDRWATNIPVSFRTSNSAHVPAARQQLTAV